jgi:hypothetical protein
LCRYEFQGQRYRESEGGRLECDSFAPKVSPLSQYEVVTKARSNHTQSTAYLVGETAAEKIIAEYGLEERRTTQNRL